MGGGGVLVNISARHVSATLAVDNGIVTLTYPDKMSPEDAEDAIEFIEIALRRVLRMARPPRVAVEGPREG